MSCQFWKRRLERYFGLCAISPTSEIGRACGSYCIDAYCIPYRDDDGFSSSRTELRNGNSDVGEFTFAQAEVIYRAISNDDLYIVLRAVGRCLKTIRLSWRFVYLPIPRDWNHRVLESSSFVFSPFSPLSSLRTKCLLRARLSKSSRPQLRESLISLDLKAGRIYFAFGASGWARAVYLSLHYGYFRPKCISRYKGRRSPLCYSRHGQTLANAM